MIDQYIDELELELRRAASRRVRVAVARAPVASGGSLAALCGVAVCVAVVLALLLQVAPARRASGGASSAARTGTAAPAAVPAGARALVSELAGMRRPQTAADRITSHVPPLIVIGSVFSRRSPGPKRLTVVPSLTRLVARMPNGRRLYLAIGRVSNGSQYVVVWLETPLTYHPVPSSERRRFKMIGPQGLLVSPALTAPALMHPSDDAVPEGIPDNDAKPISGPKTWIEIVPDTVARARWTIQYPGRPQRVTKTMRVSNNVALLRVPEGQLDEVWAINWLAPDGHVLATLTYPTAFQ